MYELPAAVKAVKDELLTAGYREIPGFDAYCAQVAVEREASSRVATEGIVVADAKGQPIPHPALEIQRKAQAEMRAWTPHLKKGSLGL